MKMTSVSSVERGKCGAALEGISDMGNPGRKKSNVGAYSCAHHAKLMDIALWSGLPEELQELVFARLPWPQIYRVRILSKGWNQKLMSGARESQLKRACARAQPKLFALLAPGDGPGSFKVNMFDTTSNRWRTFETSLGYDPQCGEIEVVNASDGGLVCFVSREQPKSKKAPRLVFVCNPLTRVWKQLPPLSGIVQQCIMVQLIMDRETKHYRVIVVGYCKDPRVGNLVNVYHSETGQWTKTDGSSSGEVVYGYLNKHNKFNSHSLFKRVPCSYNFADGLVHEFDTDFPASYAHDSVLVKDHFFLLRDVKPIGRLPSHCIDEYQAVNCGGIPRCIWSLLKKYPFNRLSRTPEDVQFYHMRCFTSFLACKDFLLLFVRNEMWKENRLEFLWLYEFSRDEWRELPRIQAGGNDLFLDQQQIMCELRLDSVP